MSIDSGEEDRDGMVSTAGGPLLGAPLTAPPPVQRDFYVEAEELREEVRRLRGELLIARDHAEDLEWCLAKLQVDSKTLDQRAARATGALAAIWRTIRTAEDPVVMPEPEDVVRRTIKATMPTTPPPVVGPIDLTIPPAWRLGISSSPDGTAVECSCGWRDSSTGLVSTSWIRASFLLGDHLRLFHPPSGIIE